MHKWPKQGSKKKAALYLCCALHNCLALEGRDVVCNLCSVLSVVHEQQLKLLDIMHDKLAEA